jgi:hypothetical protein
MLRTLALLLGVAVVFALASGVRAEEKEKTLEGTITCAKCDLKKANSCATVIKVKEGDKEVIYWFDQDSHDKHHKEICEEAKAGTVKGKVKKDGDKMIIAVSELKFK